MKKKITLLSLILILCSCGSNNSSPNSPNLSASDSLSTPVSTSSADSTSTNFDKELRSHEYIFTDVLNNLSNNYSTVTFKCDDSGFTFMNASRQSANISTVPVVNAALSSPTYITMLSDSLYDLSRIGMSITLYSNSDKDYLGESYYIGMEYLYDGDWIRCDQSIAKENITVGALKDENDIFYFNVPKEGVRKARIVLDVPNLNDQKIRFGIYSLFIEGYQRIIETNPQTTSINIVPPQTTKILVTSQMRLTANVTSSNSRPTPIIWTSSDRYIATVNEEGVVKGVTTGTVSITAESGVYRDSIVLSVVEDLSISGYVQPKVTLSNHEELPAGFTTNIVESYTDSIKFANTDDYLLTPTYEKVNSKTLVIISIKHSTGNSEALQNIFAVEGIDENGEVVEEKLATGITSTSFIDVKFEFSNINIVQYRIYYKYKALQAGASYPVGKNYGVRSLEIIKLSS